VSIEYNNIGKISHSGGCGGGAENIHLASDKIQLKLEDLHKTSFKVFVTNPIQTWFPQYK
jgi:hypothetical protein